MPRFILFGAQHLTVLLLLRDDLERLVVEAKRMSLDLEDLLNAVEEHWGRLSAERAEERSKAQNAEKE